MYKLLNSAMMPKPGTYHMTEVTKEFFCQMIRIHFTSGNMESYIGYPQNVDLIKRWTGVEVPVSRETATLEDGDNLLVMKLKYRFNAPKGTAVNHDDFEFFLVQYHAEVGT